jgi:hypothetical protein
MDYRSILLIILVVIILFMLFTPRQIMPIHFVPRVNVKNVPQRRLS